MATETFSDACIISCTVETNGPHGGDAGHGSRTVISLKDEGGTGWDARLVGHDGRAQTIEGPKEVRLEVEHLSLASVDPFGTSLKDICLKVRSGEIVGIAGVSGNGQKELMATLSGERLCPEASMIKLMGQEVGTLNPAKRRAHGLTFVPEERLGRGAVPPMTLAYNALLTGAQQGMVQQGLIRPAVMRGFSRTVIDRFRVKCGGDQSVASSLSGGNLQKYIVGRETMLQPKMMIVAQPTWGVDVGAAQLIRQALIDLRDQGVGLLVISEELDELFSISDRIAVLAGGRLSPSVKPAETSIEQIGTWMSGKFGDPAPAASGVSQLEAAHV